MCGVRYLIVLLFHYLATGTYQSFLNIEELTNLNYGVEMSIVPVLFQQDHVSANVLHMSSKFGQRYACILPTVESPTETEINSKTEANNLVTSLLNEVLNDTCHLHTDGWWTYNLCYKKAIQQYHISQETGEAEGETTLIGSYFQEDDWSDEKVVKENSLEKAHNHRYENGSICDLTSKSRRAQVQFTCSQIASREDGIVKISEPSTCEYHILFHHKKLCKHPVFRSEEKRDSEEIICSPALTSEQYESYLKRVELKNQRKENLLKRLRMPSFMDDYDALDTDLWKLQNNDIEESEKSTNDEKEEIDVESLKVGDTDGSKQLVGVLQHSKKLLSQRNRLTAQFSELLARLTAEVARTKELITTVESSLEGSELSDSERKWYQKMLLTLKKSYKKYHDQTKLLKSKYHLAKQVEHVATERIERIDKKIRQRKLLNYFADALKMGGGWSDDDVDVNSDEGLSTGEEEDEARGEFANDGVEAAKVNRLIASKLKTRLDSLMNGMMDVSEKLISTEDRKMKSTEDEKMKSTEDEKMESTEDEKMKSTKDEKMKSVDQDEKKRNEISDRIYVDDGDVGVTEKEDKAIGGEQSMGTDASHDTSDRSEEGDKTINEEEGEVAGKRFDSSAFKEALKLKIRVRPLSRNSKETEKEEEITDLVNDESLRGAELKRAARGIEQAVKKKLASAGFNMKGSIKVKILTSRKDFESVAGEEGGTLISSADADSFKELLLGALGGGAEKQREESRFENMEDSYNQKWNEQSRDADENDK